MQFSGIFPAHTRLYHLYVFSIFRTKVAMHAVFVKGRFTLRLKNLLCSLCLCGIFYPLPLTNTLCFAGRCFGKKKKMLFFGGVSALSFCYRDLSAWWENRIDQPGTPYHFVITNRLFLWCNALISLSFCMELCKCINLQQLTGGLCLIIYYCC